MATDYERLWEKTVGTPYKHTPGLSAIVHMRSQPRNKQPRWELINRNTLEYWQPPCQIRDLRSTTNRPPKHPLHRWDMRSAYLAAMTQVDLPYRALDHSDLYVMRTGYYRVRITRADTEKRQLPRPDRQGCAWITWDQYTDPSWPCVDSWRTDNAGTILRAWAETWRDLIAGTDDPQMRRGLKLGYAQAVGLMGSPTTGIYRPDWRHMIIGWVRASMARRLHRVHALHGLQPYKVDVDSVWYEVPEGLHYHTVGEALGVGDKIGQMRYEGVQP